MSPLVDRIDVARGLKEANVLLKNARIVSLFSGEVYKADVAVAEGIIAGVGSYSEGGIVYDLQGKYLLPGLIEGHIHIESSLLPPPEFSAVVVPRGTTTVVIDPHEIANVLGEKGIRYMLESSLHLPLDIHVMVPSCIPATSMETAGAVLGPKEIEEMLGWERTLGLGELMDFPGVICKAPEVLQKMEAARRSGKIIDGHSPGLSGLDLNAYLVAGPTSDHECINLDEAEEKLRRGMYLMIREGSAAKNLEDLIPLVNDTSLRRLLLISDDRQPDDLRHQGHLDYAIRKAISLGAHPFSAIAMTTLNPAEYFDLKGRGAIGPGYWADMIVVEDLEEFRVEKVFKNGHLVAKDGEMVNAIEPYSDPEVERTVRIAPLNADSFRVEASGENARVIELLPGQILTRNVSMKPKVRDGSIIQDPERDILKLAVIERHHASGRVGLGLVKGFGLKHGALGSSVAHDSHNLIVVGTNDEDMAAAAETIAEMGGGFVALAEGRVLAQLALPVAGLMSNRPLDDVLAGLSRLQQASRSLGCPLENPFASLSFLALPVIPELKLTDRGLFDVLKFSFVKLIEE
jgi:adenine deaminase